MPSWSEAPSDAAPRTDGQWPAGGPSLPEEASRPAGPPPPRPLDFHLKPFLVIYGFMIVFLGILAYLLAPLVKMSFLSALVQGLFWVGVLYSISALLSWTGFANAYRFSPTLFSGSPSYRRRVIGGALYWEGRDAGSLAVGLLFGAALMASAAVLQLADPAGVSWEFFALTLGALGAVLLGVIAASRRSRSGPRVSGR